VLAAPSPALNDSLLIREGTRHLRIPHDRILWVESFGEYVRIHTPDRVLMPLLSLSALEEMLPSNRFLRIHRSRIVNLDHFEGMEGQVVRIRGQEHPVGRKYRPGLLERLRLSTRRGSY
jgi:DNA-binding LytR/AlgR family response regulator